MSTPFQNRLVGTVIVAAIAIIFLPDLLDGDKKTYQEEFEPIPAAPTIDFKPKNHDFPEDKLSSLAKEQLVDETAVDDDSEASIDNEVQKIATEKVAVKPLAKSDQLKQVQSVKSDSLPAKAVANQAWVIQLGSFRHKNNVDELVNKLTKAGYKAFTRPIKTKTGTLTKVFVGPELIKTSLEKKIPELKQLTQVEGKVARFSPTK
ncbi:cell division protein DedD [Thalassotalea insulae]|uniref:Cell division protein DedD n=1 Tax=Thalassotalea insulae TaxID=2056778 RepID=A0ABQ6GN60_9GAMM|nr:SPOR domain-containing protein [Thalassotalea insulae]GLX77438.1 cell division protein DedD [Thalassotalea insulae]